MVDETVCGWWCQVGSVPAAGPAAGQQLSPHHTSEKPPRTQRRRRRRQPSRSVVHHGVGTTLLAALE